MYCSKARAIVMSIRNVDQHQIIEGLKSLNPDAMEVIAAGFEKGVPIDQGMTQGLW